MSHDLAIITVVYNNYKVLDDFFRTFTQQNVNHIHFYVSDLSIIKEPINYSKKLNVTIIPADNRGYASGINIALKQAIHKGYTKFCILNSDVYVDRNLSSSVLSSLNRHPASIIGGKIYYAPGYEFHKDRYQKKDRGNVLWYAGGSVDWNHALTPHRSVDQTDKGQHNQFEKTDFVNGCLMCFDKSVIEKVGFWDESYFLYFEDADFCERAKKKGISLYYDPSIVIWHKNAQSTGGSGSKLHEKYQENNRLRFGLRYAPFRTKVHLLKNFFFRGLK